MSNLRTSPRILIRRIVFTALACLCLTTPAMAQLGTGTINGIVQDSSGGAMPGVTMTLSNPGIVGGNQNTVTDTRGAYQFLRLVPSTTYSVRAELTGFRPAASNNIVVNADVNTRVDLNLEVGELSEQLTVTGQVQLLDTASTQNQQVLSREMLDTLPTGNDLWSIGRIVPSVLMQAYDVGGHNSFSNQTLRAHGSGNDEAKYQIDGMDVSHGSGSGSGSTLYFDTFMFEEVNYTSGNNPAEIAQGGVVYSLITKTGSDRFRVDSRVTGTHHRLQANNLSPAVQARLLEGVPARVLAVSPNPRNGILHIVDANISISGPIVRSKLWFVTTGKLNPLQDVRLGSYEADGTQMVGKNLMRNRSFKISWQASQNNLFHVSHDYNRKGEMTFLPGSETGSVFGEARSTVSRRNRINAAQARWTSVFPKALLDVAYSHHYGVSGVAENEAVKPGDLPRFDLTTSTQTGAANVLNYQYPLKPVFISSLTLPSTGTHEIKFGYQFNGNFYGNDAYSMSHYPAGLVARYRNGVPDSVQTFNHPVETQNNTTENALYIQDRWTPLRKLTLNVGLRLEHVAQWFPASCQEETIFIARQCFPEGRAPDWLNLAPRFGMIYDLFGDGRTALKFAANRYWPGIGIGLIGSINPVQIGVTDTRSWTDRNRDLIPQLDELGPSTGFNLGTTNRFDPDLKRPIVNEINAEIERQLPGNIVVAAGYFYRARKQYIGRRNLAVPRESYTPITVTEVVSGRQVTVYNQDPALRGRFDVLFHNAPENDIIYNGFDLTFNKRMSNRWMIMSGLSVSKNTGRHDQNADLNDPNVQFSDGLFENEVPVSFKLSGAYELPFDLKASGTFQHFTGFPEDTTVLVTSATVPLTRVTQSLRVEPRGTTRLPDVRLLDLSLKKLIRAGRSRIEPGVDLFNVFNAAPIQLRIAQLGPTYGRPSRILPGRILRFSLSMGF